MNTAAAAANLVWAGASQLAWRRFRSATANPHSSQLEVLARTLYDNAGTVTGRTQGFAQMLSRSPSDLVRAYQDSVPLTTYDDLEPLIARVAAGERGVLTQADVRRLAPSSGSTSAAKLIPHTDALQQEFSLAVDAWMADLYRSHPSLIGGRAYWSVTPSVSFDAAAKARLGSSSAKTAVPIGFDDDSAYLGVTRQMLVRAMLAVPNEVRWLADPEAFRYVTLLFLVRARDLRLISVWHPSFLSRLLEALPGHFDRIAGDIERGTLTAPAPIPSGVNAHLVRLLRPNRVRARELRRLKRLGVRDVWPRLALVSCWGDGPARPFAERLGESLEGIAVQRKGLIATEAIVSIPFQGAHPVAIRSHFFEFACAKGCPRLAHELERGEEYSPIVTTGGGLYRYVLGDRVTVDGWIGDTPSLRFVGRGDAVSDRFGEKLSDGFVTGVLDALFQGLPAPRFAMLTPEITTTGWAYTLLVESDVALPPELEPALERGLRRNPHYAWCVDLGQLRPARVVTVGPRADSMYVDECVARGQRLGDVKPVSLHKESGWVEKLSINPNRQNVD